MGNKSPDAITMPQEDRRIFKLKLVTAIAGMAVITNVVIFLVGLKELLEAS